MTARPEGLESTEYGAYLKIPELLSLQSPVTEGAHDELLFIVIHQAYELLFKLILHEAQRARAELDAGEAYRSQEPLRRIGMIFDVLDELLSLMESMPVDSFLTFRDPLAPASGGQSWQFRDILDAVAGPESLWTSLCACLTRSGIPMPAGDDAGPARLASLTELYRRHDTTDRTVLRDVCELVLEVDERITAWRQRHMLLAERQIGDRTGTGGTTGVGYLRDRLRGHLLPDLWSMRSGL